MLFFKFHIYYNLRFPWINVVLCILAYIKTYGLNEWNYYIFNHNVITIVIKSIRLSLTGYSIIQLNGQNNIFNRIVDLVFYINYTLKIYKY